MSEASDIRELTVLVFMTRSLAGTVAATKTSGPPYALIHVSMSNERSSRNVVGTVASAAEVCSASTCRGGKNHKSFAHMECTCE